MNNAQIKRSLLIVAFLMVPLIVLNVFGLLPADAAVVTLTPTNQQIVLGGADVTYTYTASTAIEAIGTTYEVIISPALPGNLANCTAATTAIDATSGGAGSFSGFSTTGGVFTTTTATTTTGRTFCIKFPAETTADSYSVMISTSTGDFGLALVHYANNNDINVSATVSASLSFNLVNLTDTGDTNTCALGNVTTLTAVDLDALDDGVGECGYGLAVGTNATNGFTIQIDGSANGLYNGSHTMTNVSGAFGTGTEEYGLANVTVPAGVTAAGGFSGANGYSIPTTATNFASAAAPFTYTSGVNDTDIVKVVHGLTVGTGTPVGSYTQTVTYTVVANF